MANDAVGNAVQGYSRAEVDEFLAAAAVERARLEAEIIDARSRVGRARSAIGMHRVMVAMLLETQRDLTDLRAQADAEADAILAQAERDAALILAGSGDEVARVTPVAPVGLPSAPIGRAAGEIHLGAADPVSLIRAEPPVEAPAGPLAQGASAAQPQTAESDDYFDFLRGALVDESPLGPGPEQS
jgi:hypothetical protein